MTPAHRHDSPTSILATAVLGLALACAPAACQNRDKNRDKNRAHAGQPAQASPAMASPSSSTTSAGAEPYESALARSGEPLRERVLIDNIIIEIADPDSGPTALLEPRPLGRDLGHLLSSSPYFTPRPDHVPDGYRARHAEIRARISYQVRLSTDADGDTDADARPGLRVLVESQTVFAAAGPSDASLTSSLVLERALLESESWRSILAVLVTDAMAGTGHGLIAKEQLRVGGDPALESGLSSDDPELVLYALELVAERGRARFFDAAGSRLASLEPAIRDHALRALVAIGDPRAVELLAKRADFADLRFMDMVLDAVIALGGDDAREYLEFIASGHPSEALRTQAREGLSRLERTPAATE